MVLNVHTDYKVYWRGDGGGGGYGGGGRGRLYTYCYAVTTRMTPALRWAAMRAILMPRPFYSVTNWFAGEAGQSVRRAEVDSNRGRSAYQPNASPLGQTGSPWPDADHTDKHDWVGY